MVTVSQAKAISERVAILYAVERFGMKQNNDMKQVLMDGFNFTVTEYVTRDRVMALMGDMLKTLSVEQQTLFVDTVLGVGQDMLMQKFGGNKDRRLMQSVIGFSVANFGTQELRTRFPDLFA
jgi:hypothetical protein